MYCDPWQTAHAVSIPLSYWQNYLNKVTMNFDKDRGKWSDSYSDLSCSSGHRYPRQEFGGGEVPKNRNCHGNRDKITVPDDNDSPAKQPLAYQHSVLSLHINTCVHTLTHTNTPSHKTFAFTQAHNTNATSEVKSKLFWTYTSISTAIAKLKNQNAVFIS